MKREENARPISKMGETLEMQAKSDITSQAFETQNQSFRNLDVLKQRSPREMPVTSEISQRRCYNRESEFQNRNGLGRASGPVGGAELLRRAAELENPKAMAKYAELVIDGPGYLAKDYALAKGYLETIVRDFVRDRNAAVEVTRARDLPDRI
jgi:TPR repeat protein